MHHFFHKPKVSPKTIPLKTKYIQIIFDNVLGDYALILALKHSTYMPAKTFTHPCDKFSICPWLFSHLIFFISMYFTGTIVLNNLHYNINICEALVFLRMLLNVGDSDKHLGNYISTNIADRHIIDNIYDLYSAK